MAEAQDCDVMKALDRNISKQDDEIDRRSMFPKVSDAVKEEAHRFAAFSDWREYKRMEAKRYNDLQKYVESVEIMASHIQNQRQHGVEDVRNRNEE